MVSPRLFGCPHAGLALALVVLVGAAPAEARIRTPIPTLPTRNQVVQAMPSFAWHAVPGADHYDFRLSPSKGFDSTGQGVGAFSTHNTFATVDAVSADSTYYWQVRAVPAAGHGKPGAWSAVRTFVKRWSASAVLSSPVAGGTITYPGAAVLSWSAVPYAYKYRVSIARDPALATLIGGKAIETTGTSLTPNLVLSAGTYYWSVIPLDGRDHPGLASEVRSFVWSWNSATTPTMTSTSGVDGVPHPRFSWPTVAGAASYIVEINSSSDFASSSKVDCSCVTAGTTFTPTAQLPANVYYWRVKALDPAGDAGVWNEGPQFDAGFLLAPQPHMRDNLATTGTDVQPGVAGYQTNVPIVTWNPVPGASQYLVDVEPFVAGSEVCDDTSNGGVHWRVTTPSTSWTPLGTGKVGTDPYSAPGRGAAADTTVLVPNQRYCVKVTAIANGVTGQTAPLLGTGGEPWAFQWTGYPPTQFQGTAQYLATADYGEPVTGTITSRTPLFTWTPPAAGAQSYYVVVAKDRNFSTVVDYAFTQVPAYAPRDLTYKDETTSYYWAVLASRNLDGSLAGGTPTAATPHQFQKQSTPPAQVGDVGGDQPSFGWALAEGAKSYHFQVAADDKFSTPIDDVTTAYTSYSSTSSYAASTQLYWRVQAVDQNDQGLTWSAARPFARVLPAPVPAADNATHGDAVPVWRWSLVPNAIVYDAQVVQPDGSVVDWTNIPGGAAAATEWKGNGTWRWRVRARFPKLGGGSEPGAWSADSTFNRTFAEPLGLAVTYGPGRMLVSWSPKDGARQYQLQISRTADFSSTLKDVTIDGTTYAPDLDDTAYRATPVLYYRVRALDSGSQPGSFTTARTMRFHPRLSLSTTDRPTHGLRSLVRVTVLDPANQGVGRVWVRLSGRGFRPIRLRTRNDGSVVIPVMARARGRLLLTATKKGYAVGTMRLLVI